LIKALFFDLDGTLLNTKGEISPNTRQALEKCQENNIKLYLATARPPLLDKMLSWSADTLSLFDGGSYYNGGCVIVGKQKAYTFIPPDLVQRFINEAAKYHTLNIALQLGGEKHAFRFPLEEICYKSWGVTADEALSLDWTGNLQTIKILIFYANLIDSTTPIDSELVETLRNLSLGAAQFYLNDQGKCVQIMAQDENKLSRIKKIRVHLGYAKNEIAVFGDDDNDLEMLSAYEYSVAMGNAENHVKNSANHITLDNDSDGIAHAIHRILHLVEA